ncbi:MAG TPA: hypothetical protein VGB15_07205 [Longimicrobium sp.]|jgi:hypothetical protein
MRFRRMGTMLLAALALSACGDEGGELRDVTARRRAELDTAGANGADTAPGIPAFAGDTTPRAGADSAKADTAKADSAKAPAGAVGEWTVGVREMRHSGVNTTLRGLRTAANAGFDRLVLDFGDAPLPGWRVEYVDQPLHQCGSGDEIRLGTDAALLIRLQYTRAHDDAGRATIRQRDVPLSMPVMRRMVIICDFEAVVEVAVGAASPRPFRVTELRNPSRLAIDIQQAP